MPRKKGSRNKATIAAEEAVSLLTVEGIDQKIAELESEIVSLNKAIKEKNLELKALKKSRTVAAKAAEKKKAKEDKAAILAAVEASGKSVDEILEFLK